jgi:hypothetical protein
LLTCNPPLNCGVCCQPKIAKYLPLCGWMPVVLSVKLNCGVCCQPKIAKYLPLCGWMPVVLSVKKSLLRPRYDESLLKGTKSIPVCRTSSFESRTIMRGIPRLLHINPKYVQIPDPFIGWLPFAVAKGLTSIKKEDK